MLEYFRNIIQGRKYFGELGKESVISLEHFSRSQILRLNNYSNPDDRSFLILKKIQYFKKIDGDNHDYHGIFFDSKKQYKNFDWVQIIQANFRTSNSVFFVRPQPEISKLEVMPDSISDLDLIQSITRDTVII